VGKKTGPNPTDRGKGGTKRSVLTEAYGIPIGLAVDGANRVDFKMARETIESIAADRPRPARRAAQGLCLDKGYDYGEVRELLREFSFTEHIRCRGEEAKAIKKAAGFKARRWVVERTHSWMNRFVGSSCAGTSARTPTSRCSTSHARSSLGSRAVYWDRF
jgi:hypothetical protein